MPNVTIEVRRPYTPAEEARIIDAVYDAMVGALKIPPRDKTVRLIVHEPHRFAVPAGRTDRYTLVEIDLFPGRSLAAKTALYRGIVENLAVCGIPAEEIKILLREHPREDWGIRGGIPASEVDLGFEVEV
jgi:phenylpyruvate tautomerase PptA (4-oxalocrotonate tautomerase family)